MHVVVQPFLEDATTQINCLPMHGFTDSRTQVDIVNARLPRRLHKPRSFEYAY